MRGWKVKTLFWFVFLLLANVLCDCQCRAGWQRWCWPEEKWNQNSSSRKEKRADKRTWHLPDGVNSYVTVKPQFYSLEATWDFNITYLEWMKLGRTVRIWGHTIYWNLLFSACQYLIDQEFIFFFGSADQDAYHEILITRVWLLVVP